MAAVTVGERVLVYLHVFTRFADAYECPAETTQDGIAAALGISRAHAALELKRLRESRKVEERMAHVPGARTRRKVYFLLPAGQEVARQMRDHARGKRVTVRGPDGTLDLSGVDAIEALKASGVREPEAIQRVLTSDVVDLDRAEPATPPPAPGKPFFGRTAELERLREFLSADDPALCAIIGVAGIGKTALLAKVLAGCARPVLLRRAYAHDDLHGLLSTLADFLARGGRRRLKTVLTRSAYDPAEALAVAREDLGGSVLALDDLHASPAAEGLLRSLREAPSRIKVLVASRQVPTFYDTRDREDGSVLEIHLGGLDEDAVAELLAARRVEVRPPELGRILRATQGHPLALEFFAASGIEAGGAAAERFLIETVLEGLDDRAEALLRAFAVLRRPAHSPEGLGGTVSQLRRLVRIAVVQHRSEGYLLHDLVKEFFLARMSEKERRTANARAAVYWEGRGDALEAAHHRLDAGDAEGAAALLSTAGEAYTESARAGDLEACLLRLPTELRPRRLLAETQTFLGKFSEAKEVLASLVRDGEPPDRLRARIELGRIANRLGSYEEARGILVAAAEEASRLRARDLEAEALRALGGVERKLGDLPAALEHLTRAVDLLGDGSRERVRGLLDLGAALIALGDLPAAKARLLQARARVRRGSREEAAITNNLGIVLSREGLAAEAASAFEESAGLAIQTGEMRFASYALANAADNLIRLGRMEAAGSCAERALALSETIGDPLAVSTARANLGLVYARRGEWGKAEQHLLASVDLIARLENPYSLASRFEEIAGLYEAQGRSADAAPWRERAEGLFSRLRGDSGPS